MRICPDRFFPRQTRPDGEVSRAGVVVTKTIRGLVVGLGLMGDAAFTLAGSGAELAPGLSVEPPQALGMEVQRPEGAGFPVLVGFIDAEPGYFLAATQIRGAQRTSVIWEKLEMEIRSRSESGSFRVLRRGSFNTLEGGQVWYRGYRYRQAGMQRLPVYYLVRRGEQNYWVTLTLVEGLNPDVVLPVAESVIRRMRLALTVAP